MRYAGQEIRLRDSKGLRDLARLLSRPGQPVAALELAGATGSSGGAVEDGLHEPGDLGEVIDATARSAYRRRLVEAGRGRPRGGRSSATRSAARRSRPSGRR